MRSHGQNKKYLEKLIQPLLELPNAAAIAIATKIYQGVVAETAFDSGQAALNWRLQTYYGSARYDEQEMMWGYKGVTPIPPAGYKWSGGFNEEAVKMQLMEDSIVMAVALQAQRFDGISVYNPITPGFSGFAPGNDANYVYYALGDVQINLNAIISNAVAEANSEMAERFSFVRVS